MNRKLLKKHIEKSPQMEIIDAVKLIFQSEFGCGHLLGEDQACADAVRKEIASVREKPKMEMMTLIGRGLARLNLASPFVRKLTPEIIAAMMKITADRVSSNMARFEKSLGMLMELAKGGETFFTAAQLTEYLQVYRAAGYPVVSHSQSYREAYEPAYRVVLSDFGLLAPLIIAIEEVVNQSGQALIVIDGDCGAGKTTLAGLLAALYGQKPIQLDDFFLPFELRTQARMAQAGGNVHYERFASEVLSGLKSGTPFTYHAFDCQTGLLHEKECIPANVVVVEGSYSHHPYFTEGYQKLHAIKVFVSVDETEQLRRLSRRDPAKLERFKSEWIPLEKTYFKAYDSKDRANFVLRSLTWEDEE